MKYLLFICILFCGCTRLEFELTDKRTPIISEPIQNEYDIRTRIVVKKNEAGLLTENLDQILSELNCAERIYQSINVKFIIVKCEFTNGMDIGSCYKDAKNYPNMMSVYFLDNTKDFQGEAAYPFTNSEKFGIVMMKSRLSENALAHEIGHYFGLMHTFEQNDYCDDTPKQTLKNGACDGKSPNCGNVMNYCFHSYGSATEDQCNRFLSFLINFRKNHVLPINTNRSFGLDGLRKTFDGFTEPPFKEYYIEPIFGQN